MLLLVLLEVIEIGGEARGGMALRGGLGDGPDEIEVVETVLKAEARSAAVRVGGCSTLKGVYERRS